MFGSASATSSELVVQVRNTGNFGGVEEHHGHRGRPCYGPAWCVVRGYIGWVVAEGAGRFRLRALGGAWGGRCFIPIYFGLAVAEEGHASFDLLWFAVWAAIAVGLFAAGTYFALRRGGLRQPATGRPDSPRNQLRQ